MPKEEAKITKQETREGFYCKKCGRNTTRWVGSGKELCNKCIENDLMLTIKEKNENIDFHEKGITSNTFKSIKERTFEEQFPELNKELDNYDRTRLNFPLKELRKCCLSKQEVKDILYDEFPKNTALVAHLIERLNL